MGKPYTQHGRRHGPDGSDPITFPDPVPYVPPTDNEQLYSDTVVTVADGETEQLIWTKSLGADLLDLSTPTTPLVIEDGIYSISATAQPDENLTVGGQYLLQLILEIDMVLAAGYVAQMSPPASALTPAQNKPYASCSLSIYLPAGSAVTLSVSSYDGAASRDFILYRANVQKIT